MECIECIPLNSKRNVSLKVWENLDSPKKWHDLGEVQYINLQHSAEKIIDIMHRILSESSKIYTRYDKKHFILLVFCGGGARCVWFFGVNRSLLMCRIWRAIECWHVGQHRQADGRQRDRRSTDTGLHHPTDFLHRLVCKVKSSKVNRWIYIALYYKPFVSKALGYGPRITRESHNAVLPATHTRTVCLPLLPSRKASPFFGWYSLPLPTKGWLGWVDLGGWLHTEINVRHTELNPR